MPNTEILNSILKEYEQKKIRAELELDSKKSALYIQLPELEKLDFAINSLAIQKTKEILKGNSSCVNELINKISLLKIEKEKILKQNNYNLDYLKPNYECKICSDTGYIKNNNFKSTMCSCLKQRLLNIAFNDSNMNNLNTENFSTFNPFIFSDDVDVAKYRANISPRTNIQNIMKKCKIFVENFDNKNTKNLLFTGNTGLR